MQITCKNIETNPAKTTLESNRPCVFNVPTYSEGNLADNGRFLSANYKPSLKQQIAEPLTQII